MNIIIIIVIWRNVLILLASCNCNLYDIHHCCVNSEKTPDDGQRNCPKHVEFYSKNKFEKLVHLIGFVITIRNCNHFNPSWFVVVSLLCLTFRMAFWSHPLDTMDFYYLQTFQTFKLCSSLKWPPHFVFVRTDLRLVYIAKFEPRYLSSLWKFHTNFVFRSNLSSKPSQSYGEVWGLFGCKVQGITLHIYKIWARRMYGHSLSNHKIFCTGEVIDKSLKHLLGM